MGNYLSLTNCSENFCINEHNKIHIIKVKDTDCTIYENININNTLLIIPKNLSDKEKQQLIDKYNIINNYTWSI